MRCLSLPPQCLIPFLRYSSLGSSLILALLPSHPCSPIKCFAGERERLVGLEANGAEDSIKGLVPCSSLMSFNLLGDGVRLPKQNRFDDNIWPQWRSPARSPSLRKSNCFSLVGEVRRIGDRDW